MASDRLVTTAEYRVDDRKAIASINRMKRELAQLDKSLARKRRLNIDAGKMPKVPKVPQAGRGGAAGRGGGGGGAAGGFQDILSGAGLGGVAGGVSKAAASWVGLTAAVAGAAVASVSARDRYDTLLKVIEMGVGSSQQAAREMDFLRAVAQANGVGITELSDSYGSFVNALAGTELEGKKARDIFREVTEAGAVLGVSSDALGGVFTAFSQAIGKGTLQTEEFNQIVERVPALGRAMAESMGLSVGEFRQLMGSGKILAADVLPKLADQLEKTFGNQEPVETMGKGFTRIMNQLFELGVVVGPAFKGPVIDAMNGVADGLAVVVTWIRELAEETAPLRSMLADELAAAVGVVTDMLGELLSLFDQVPGRLANIGTSLSEQFIQLGGFEGMLRTIQGLFFQMAAAAVQAGGGIAVGILEGVQWAISGLGELATAIGELPLVGDLLAPSVEFLTESVDETLASVASLADGARGLTEDLASGFDDKATKSLNKAIDVSNQKTKELAKRTQESGKKQEAANDRVRAKVDKVNAALTKLQAGIQKSRDVLAFMKQFGVDAEVAADAVEILAKVTGITADEAVTLAKEMKSAKAEVEKLGRQRAALEKFAESLEDINTQTKLLSRGMTFEDAADAMQLMKEAGVDAETAVSMLGERTEAEMAAVEAAFQAGTLTLEEYNRAMMDPEAFEAWKARQADAAAIVDELKSAYERYREEIERVRELQASGDLTEEQAEEAIKGLDAQMDGWDRLAMAALDAAASTEGAWGKVLQGIGEGIDSLAAGFDMLAGFAAERGDEANAQWLGAAGSAMEGDWGGAIAGAVGASGLGGGGTSQFGGRESGNMMAQGAQFGAMFGGWGAVIGAVVGAMVKTGADDFHSHMAEAAGYADIVVTQAEGELAEVAAQIEETVENILREVQDSLIADLDFGMEGFEIHIREDRVRVVANGIEKVFHDLDEAMDFFLRGVFQANAGVEGLSEEVRKFFENASGFSPSAGDPERLLKGFELAQKLDFQTTGVDQELIRARQKEMELAAEFGLDLGKLIALRQHEAEVAKRSLLASAVGMTDFATALQDLARQFEVINNTADAEYEANLRRRTELENLIAANDQVIYSESEGAEAHLGLAGAAREGSKWVGEFDGTIAGGNTTLGHAIDLQKQYQRELEGINQSLELAPTKISAEEIARAINAGAAEGAKSIAGLILGAVDAGLIEMDPEERLELEKQLFELEKVTSIAQLYAASVQLEAMLALAEVSGVTRDALLKLRDDIPGWIEGIAVAEFTPRAGGRGGGGRRAERERREEERRRREEEAAKTLGEFNDELRRMSLNARNASGVLGDLSAQFEEIARRSAEALAAGASEADVRRWQELQFAQIGQGLNPFDMSPRTYAGQSRDIDKQAQAAKDNAMAWAEAQGALFGLTREQIQALYDDAAEDIDKGAARFKNDAARAIMDSFGLPIEGVRREMQQFRRSLKDLEAAYKDGTIAEARYKDLLKQISDQQAQVLGSETLDFAERWGLELEGQEELRLQMMQLEYAVGFASLKLRYEELKALGVLDESLQAMFEGVFSQIEGFTPDWETLLGGGQLTGGGAGGSGGGTSGGIAQSSSNLDSLLDSIRNFIDGINAVDVGPFERMALDFTESLRRFTDDLTQELRQTSPKGFTLESHAVKVARNFLGEQVGSLADLTEEQLQRLADADLSGIAGFTAGVDDIFDALLGLQQVEELRPKVIRNILDAYADVDKGQSRLEVEFQNVLSRYDDVRAALIEIGASAADFAEAEAAYFAERERFLDEAMSGIRNLVSELRGGRFAGLSEAQRRTQAQSEYDRLLEAATLGDLAALEQLGAAGQALIEAEMAFTGGFGFEFDRIRRNMLDDLSDLGVDLPGATPTETLPGAINNLDANRAADAAATAARDSIREGQLNTLIDLTQQLLANQTPQPGGVSQ